MLKLHCTVITPITGKRYRMWIPDSLVSEAVGFIAALIERRERRQIFAYSPKVLLHAETGAELSRNSMISEYSFVDGTELVLI